MGDTVEEHRERSTESSFLAGCTFYFIHFCLLYLLNPIILHYLLSCFFFFGFVEPLLRTKSQHRVTRGSTPRSKHSYPPTPLSHYHLLNPSKIATLHSITPSRAFIVDGRTKKNLDSGNILWKCIAEHGMGSSWLFSPRDGLLISFRDEDMGQVIIRFVVLSLLS